MAAGAMPLEEMGTRMDKDDRSTARKKYHDGQCMVAHVLGAAVP